MLKPKKSNNRQLMSARDPYSYITLEWTFNLYAA